MRFLRRRILIDGIQYRMLVASLVYCLVVATVLGACVFGPMLAELRGAPTYSEERVEMANAFLYLSTRLLTFGVLLFALLGFHSVLLSHRIAGPLYSLRFGSYASSMDDLLNSGLVADFDRSPNAAYTYTYTATGATWALNAAPTIAGVTGDVEFYVDQTGVIRFSTSGPASAASPPVD